LDGAFNFDATAAGDLVTDDFAARLVWLDALVTNPDRTHKNANLMVWDGQPWLIDHGAALYAHHDWARVDEARTRTPFPLIRTHLMLARGERVEALDAELAALLDDAALAEILAAVPDELLAGPQSAGGFETAAEARERYRTYLRDRLSPPRAWVAAAVEARATELATAPRSLSARR
ncbi:MAG TPA: hypothetical protein VFH27_02475, partial [Longimicrobiaceae bacterium]|nr:hypothetical protein [Longimicrobiaceae bacterium]